MARVLLGVIRAEPAEPRGPRRVPHRADHANEAGDAEDEGVGVRVGSGWFGFAVRGWPSFKARLCRYGKRGRARALPNDRPHCECGGTGDIKVDNSDSAKGRIGQYLGQDARGTGGLEAHATVNTADCELSDGGDGVRRSLRPFSPPWRPQRFALQIARTSI